MVKKADPMLGKINVYPEKDGKQHVEIYILIESPVEGLHAGIAIDASRSMLKVYGADVPKAFREANPPIEKVVRALSKYATRFTGDGTVALQYWALTPGGDQVEALGSFGAAECGDMEVSGPAGTPTPWGNSTKLVPAVNEFMDNIPSSSMAMWLVITDGVIEDMEDLKKRSMEIGQEMVDDPEKKRKFVIVALFHDGITEKERAQIGANLEEIDDMFEETKLGEQGIDLWDTKIAAEMEDLREIWEEVDFGIRIPGSARIMDDQGEELESFSDGFPQKLEFYVKAGTPYVTLELAGTTIKQSLKDE